jgi:hypothetical protein
MKIVNAIWERRNLGVRCIEVTLEATDAVPDVKSTLAGLDTQYLVIKVPAGRSDLMFCLSEPHRHRTGSHDAKRTGGV